MPTVTMVDKACKAAADRRAELLDLKVYEEFRIQVKTAWNVFSGHRGAYETKRVDGEPISPGMQNYITGLWNGWQLHEETLLYNQARGRR